MNRRVSCCSAPAKLTNGASASVAATSRTPPWGRSQARIWTRHLQRHSSGTQTEWREFTEADGTAGSSTQSGLFRHICDGTRISGAGDHQPRSCIGGGRGQKQMVKLRIDAIEDDKPVSLAVKLLASAHGDL
jgi:hypothetical protein